MGEKDVREAKRRRFLQQHINLLGRRDFAFSPPLLSSNYEEKAGKRKATPDQYKG